MNICDETKKQIKPSIVLLNKIPHSRLFDEVMKFFLTGHATESIKVFKSYEELASRLNKVLGRGIDPNMQRAEDTVIGTVDHTSIPFDGGVPNRPPVQQQTQASQVGNVNQGNLDNGEGDTLSYFAKLAEEE